MGEEEADRLAFLGRSSAALAHEVSNPLTAALLALDQLERARAGDAGPSEPAFEELRASLEHAREIVKEFARYAAAPRPTGPVDLAEVATAAQLLTRGPSRGRARLELAAGAVPRVDGSRTRLVQAAVNLVANALAAVEGGDDPRIRLRTDEDRARRWIGLHVEDNGRGVPASVADCLFEPFVTGGAGSGLGLWIARQIAVDHGGVIEHSRTDGWTRFSLWIPATRH